MTSHSLVVEGLVRGVWDEFHYKNGGIGGRGVSPPIITKNVTIFFLLRFD